MAAATACQRGYRLRQLAMVGPERRERLLAAAVGVDVEDEQPGDGAGRKPDVGTGPARPPFPDLPGIRRRLLQPRPFARVLPRALALITPHVQTPLVREWTGKMAQPRAV